MPPAKTRKATDDFDRYLQLVQEAVEQRNNNQQEVSNFP